jgi:hypothetical protein
MVSVLVGVFGMTLLMSRLIDRLGWAGLRGFGVSALALGIGRGGKTNR